ncbi:PcfJ domain-containing protein [Acinetobacter pragensis]|uniref:Uncharacterized protein n=1 Tax=Acinetobacter pragensis TaxID=1806892 RepID=A0A151XZU0_9GAMM|nr:PcfJ domain-containing protein [Acinetobacter pragensis]KYQ71321.1 hypothetical protein AZH43_15255 [Acinetobacter pragensis]
MQKEVSVPEWTAAARQLLRISPELSHLVQAQQDLASQIAKHQLFKIDREQQRIQIAYPFFYIQFHTPHAAAEQGASSLVCSHFVVQHQKAELLEDFFMQDVHFLTGDLKAQHPLFLRTKAQQIREILAKEIISWAFGTEKIKTALQQMSLAQAEFTDELMMTHQLYSQPILQACLLQQKPIPESAVEKFLPLLRLDTVLAHEFLPLQPLMESFDEFCFSAAQFLDPAVFRIASLFYREQFNLNELIELEDDIGMLYAHAKEQPQLLGFARLMNREVWRQSDLFSKPHFLTANHRIWQKKAAVLPLFDCVRAVNWLFKQSLDVLDWISQNVQHSNIRTAVTALSYVDCSQMHPQIILAALQYFQHVSARLFIQSCHAAAIEENWFEHPENQAVVLQGTRQAIDDHRVAIRPSILYLDEWMALASSMAKSDELAMKKVYLRMSRVMQAFMLHLRKITADFPEDLMDFILPDTQQDRDFYAVLHCHKMPQDMFRQQFYLQHGAVRKSIFDAYVRDYLSAYFSETKRVPKTVTWTGLFYQAAIWHQKIQTEEILAKLKKEFSCSDWKPFTVCSELYFDQWRFQELQSVERIIDESQKFQHCLAASYAQRIIEGQYSAFHMSHVTQPLRMTLGCIRQDGQLIFDQLELPHNEKAEECYVQIAKQFIDWLNAEANKKSNEIA